MHQAPASSGGTGGTEDTDRHTGSLQFIGTATVLLRYGGFTILTDPNFLHAGEKVHLGYGLTSTRLTNPALEIDDVPPLDLVVLSHMHEDHFDRVAEQRLSRSVPIVTTGQAAAALRGKGFTETRSLDTWQTWSFRKEGTRLRITALPAQHPPLALLKPMLPTVMGSLLDFQDLDGRSTLRVYVTGDTLLHDALADVPRHFPDIDLALLHLGGTRILGVMLTMDGRQGAEVLRLVAPRTAIPVHYDDYTVFRSPLADFRRAVHDAGLDDRVHYLDRGDSYTLLARS